METSTAVHAKGSWPQRLYRRLRSILLCQYWMVGVIDQPIRNALGWTQIPPVRWIAPFDRKRYFADPFPWPGSTDTILCEDFDLASRYGAIAALKLDANGVAIETRVDFPLRVHMSFPFLFLRDGAVYAMPETCAARRLEIFRWREDGTWVSHAVIFDDCPVADAILFEKDGLFWISYTDVSEDPHDNLHLIYASDLTGPWYYHPANPVRRGREWSRNGGGVFEVDGRLYRPAQDCTRLYGGALRIMEIVACTVTSYEEREVARLAPNARAYPDGFHTLVEWGDKCLVDGMRLIFSPRLVWNKLKRRLRF